MGVCVCVWICVFVFLFFCFLFFCFLFVVLFVVCVLVVACCLFVIVFMYFWVIVTICFCYSYFVFLYCVFVAFGKPVFSSAATQLCCTSVFFFFNFRYIRKKFRLFLRTNPSLATPVWNLGYHHISISKHFEPHSKNFVATSTAVHTRRINAHHTSWPISQHITARKTGKISSPICQMQNNFA